MPSAWIGGIQNHQLREKLLTSWLQWQRRKAINSTQGRTRLHQGHGFFEIVSTGSRQGRHGSGASTRPTPKEIEPKSNVGICYIDCQTLDQRRYEKQKKLHCEVNRDAYAKRTAGRVASTPASQGDRIDSTSRTTRAGARLRSEWLSLAIDAVS
jgi:hypothetical protein